MTMEVDMILYMAVGAAFGCFALGTTGETLGKLGRGHLLVVGTSLLGVAAVGFSFQRPPELEWWEQRESDDQPEDVADVDDVRGWLDEERNSSYAGNNEKECLRCLGANLTLNGRDIGPGNGVVGRGEMYEEMQARLRGKLTADGKDVKVSGQIRGGILYPSGTQPAPRGKLDLVSPKGKKIALLDGKVNQGQVFAQLRAGSLKRAALNAITETETKEYTYAGLWGKQGFAVRRAMKLVDAEGRAGVTKVEKAASILRESVKFREKEKTRRKGGDDSHDHILNKIKETCEELERISKTTISTLTNAMNALGMR